MNLFAYGTLMCAEIMEEVAGCRPVFCQGTLKDYCRRALRGEHYPAIVPLDGDRVPGVLYLDLSAAAWERLDRFEGEMYLRRPVQIEVDQGGLQPAETYVLHPDFGDRLTADPWDFDRFLKTGKAIFQQGYKGYHAL